MRADLHLHSTSSDGIRTPGELVVLCKAQGISVMALTDHDTFSGVDSLCGQELPLTLIPGIELSMRDLPGLHLLGYGLTKAPLLRARVDELCRKRVDRAHAMVERLAAMGMPLDWPELLASVGDSIGRPHIARAMIKRQYVRSMEEAFGSYLGHDRPAYVPGERMDMKEALTLMRRSGFIPVLAHPAELKLPDHLLQPLL